MLNARRMGVQVTLDAPEQLAEVDHLYRDDDAGMVLAGALPGDVETQEVGLLNPPHAGLVLGEGSLIPLEILIHSAGLRGVVVERALDPRLADVRVHPSHVVNSGAIAMKCDDDAHGYSGVPDHRVAAAYARHFVDERIFRCTHPLPGHPCIHAGTPSTFRANDTLCAQMHSPFGRQTAMTFQLWETESANYAFATARTADAEASAGARALGRRVRYGCAP